MKWSAALLILAGACNRGAGPSAQPQVPVDREGLIRSNRDAMRLEDRDIALYAERHGFGSAKSGTGVVVHFVRDSAGAAVAPEQVAVVRYTLQLLSGEEVHATEPAHPEAFRVAHDDVESGLHEAIQRMSPGDSAVVIIPSYRAHGLIGDQDRIPPRTSVVYRIGLVRIVP
jgi:FKBP-type peptidyl-prolyl cis-trans isomerase FkpA